MRRAFDREAAAELDNIDPNSYQAHRHKTPQASVEFLQDAHEVSLNVLGSLLVSEPCDRLSSIVQHCDMALDQASIIEFVAADDPIHKAQIELYDLLFREGSYGAKTLVRHLSRSGTMKNIRKVVLSTAAQVWARLVLVYFEWLWRLFRLVHPDATDAQIDDLCDEFGRALQCDLDVGISVWIMKQLKSSTDLRRMMGMLRHVGNNGPVANMSLENLLALIKASTPAGNRCVNAERLCHLGTLSMHMRHYLAIGNDDHRIFSRKRLKASGVPLKSSKQLARKASSKS